ncbi:MAG: PPC domain-containing protein [Candidatus Thermoplasmatota archaeon]|nr:PPC domain-containing protein [Candidatus Thermoplasmatota archaeon]
MNYKKTRIEAVIFAVVLLGTAFFLPASSQETANDHILNTTPNSSILPDGLEDPIDHGVYQLDRNYYSEPELLNLDDVDDGGYRRDAGDEISRATCLYPGEPIDDTPGRGNTGKLSASDDEDWYFFSVCNGQTIAVSLDVPTGYNYDLGLWDKDGIEVATSTNGGDTTEIINYVATVSGSWYLRVHYISGTDEAQYILAISIVGQNDANSGNDAGDVFANAILITQGTYYGYLDQFDPYDFYKFDVTNGDGLHFNLNVKAFTYLTDFDISLYNPDGDKVYEEDYYYDDELFYPADMTGEWAVKIDIFPGWVDMPQPTEWEYYTYGSGAYQLIFAKESSVPAPPGPIPQPDITPIAKTFIINNDFESNADEYGYFASIPACNYLEGGQRYLAPIVYQGDDTDTSYFDTGNDQGDVDDTTQYLIDDWDTYLASHGKTATQYIVPADPIEAAAEIAQNNWVSSDLAVVAVDGSGYQDTIKEVLKRTATLKRETEVETIHNDDPKIQNIGGSYGYPMFLGPKWCAINVSMFGSGGAEPSLNAIIPHFMQMGGDWWPSPYDIDGPKIDIWFPVTRMGVWTAGTDKTTGDWDFIVTKYAGDRYRVRVTDSDVTLSATVTTDTPSDLQVFLVDPDGHIKAPDLPLWNGPVLPIHQWNGFHNATGFDRWRTWNPEPSTEVYAEVLHPDPGYWTVIVVPRYAEGAASIKYTVTGEVKTISPKRAHAAMSAANAAVIASLEHAPLLYVTEDSIPTETQAAFTNLGVNNVIFVNRGGIGDAVAGDLPTITDELTTTQEIVDYIKAYDASENYITFTSIKSGNGYEAPAAMLAAYHGSPVLRIGEAPGNPAGVADRIETWRIWEGDYYHGSRAPGHLPVASEPITAGPLQVLIEMIKFLLSSGSSGELPPFGMDAKRYWNEELHDGIYNYINSLGLDLEGQEGYVFVSPRDDIYLPAHSVMMGNNSFAGHIPGLTTAYISAVINRNVLYSALIFANPGRDVTTTQMMNFPDGGSWKTNDGKTHQIYSSREVKKSFGSHGREYIGHCLWEAHLDEMNSGASAFYYSGHGTGGSGQSAQYLQTEHCDYPDQIWWDSWRGYTYDSWKTARFNGQVWYNADPPMLYDIIHYEYLDELYENLHSNAIFYMSCSTGDSYGPMVGLDHGAVVWYGNAGSGLCPEADLQDDEFLKYVMIDGWAIGPAYSTQVWLHFRDFTTSDPTSMYGSSSMQVTTVQCIYGDPALVVYSPEWSSPEPIDA